MSLQGYLCGRLYPSPLGKVNLKYTQSLSEGILNPAGQQKATAK